MAKRKHRLRKKSKIGPPKPPEPDFKSLFSPLPSASDLLKGKEESLSYHKVIFLRFSEMCIRRHNQVVCNQGRYNPIFPASSRAFFPIFVALVACPCCPKN
jgi:hypothetical protein